MFNLKSFQTSRKIKLIVSDSVLGCLVFFLLSKWYSLRVQRGLGEIW